jgi:hypothetical protein
MERPCKEDHEPARIGSLPHLYDSPHFFLETTLTINALQLNTSTPWTGLGTATYNVVTTGIYTLAVECTIPYNPPGSTSANSASTVGQSGLTIVATDVTSTTTLMTLGGASSNPTPTQPSLSGKVSFQATAGDVVTVVFSSPNSVDSTPNAVKAVINLYSGE